jgi:flagellar biosynthesis/type III secretory pathway protein FliH
VHFNTYEDMETAIANVRIGLEEPNTEFLAAMIEMFERELEDACEKADSAGYDAGMEAGEYSGYEEGWQKGYDEARQEMPKGQTCSMT